MNTRADWFKKQIWGVIDAFRIIYHKTDQMEKVCAAQHLSAKYRNRAASHDTWQAIGEIKDRR